MSQPATHQVAPPPQDSTLVRNVALILGAAITIQAMAAGIALLLSPITVPVLMAAIGLSGRSSTPKPRPRMRTHGISPGGPGADVARAAADRDLYFRASYVINAARRLQRSLDDGGTLAQAVAEEARFAKLHDAARRNRLDSAGSVARAAETFGPLLGWYRDPTSNSEAECIAADGHNFDALSGTVIGLPGSVHQHCHCVPGPPHEGAGLVNDAVAHLLSRPARKFRLAETRRTA